MKALFGVVSLLFVLAVGGMLATRQLKASGQLGSSAVLPAATGAPSASAASGQTVREQSQRLQQRVGDDIKKALEQGAVGRGDESHK